MRPPRVATVILLCGAVAGALSLARMLMLLRQLWHPGSATSDLVRVSLVAAVLLAMEAVLLAALRLSPARRASVALATVSTVGVLYAAELGLEVSLCGRRANGSAF